MEMQSSPVAMVVSLKVMLVDVTRVGAVPGGRDVHLLHQSLVHVHVEELVALVT
jgi:hypothetical protein